MKRGLYLVLLPSLLLLMAACSTSKQASIANDDVYYNGVRGHQPALASSGQSTMTNKYDRNGYSRSGSRVYDDSYDYYYSSRINRFQRPYSGMSYYSGCYTNYRYYDRNYSGWNIYSQWGTPYYNRPSYCNSCWGNSWNSYTYYYNTNYYGNNCSPCNSGFNNYYSYYNNPYNNYYNPYNSYNNDPASYRGTYTGPRSSFSSNVVTPSPRGQYYTKTGSGKSDETVTSVTSGSRNLTEATKQENIQQGQTNQVGGNTAGTQTFGTQSGRTQRTLSEEQNEQGQVAQRNTSGNLGSAQQSQGTSSTTGAEGLTTSQRSLTNTNSRTVGSEDRAPRTYSSPLNSRNVTGTSTNTGSTNERTQEYNTRVTNSRQQMIDRESSQRNYTTRTSRYSSGQVDQQSRTPQTNDSRQQRYNTNDRQNQNTGTRWIDRSTERQQPQQNSRNNNYNSQDSRNSNNNRTVQPSRSTEIQNSQPRTQPSRNSTPSRQVKPQPTPSRNSGGSGRNYNPPSRSSGSGSSNKSSTPSRNSGGRR